MSALKITNDKQLKKDYETMSSGEIAKKYGCTRTTVCRHLRRLGITKPISGTNSRNRKRNGEVLKTGYPVFHLPEHPRASAVGYVFKHILEVEKKIGRVPTRNEPIHHIDFDRTNYNIENLYLCKDNKEHKDAHVSLEMLARDMFHKGIIGFKKGKYYLV